MRSIKTFVLHLYLDSNVPDRLCGDVRLLDEPKPFAFKNQQEFFAILSSLVIKNMLVKPALPEDDPTADA